MSDLQCAVTVIVLESDHLGDVDRLRAARPAAVHATAGLDDAAADLARQLDVTYGAPPLDGASPVGLIAALEELSDEYRGECVAVVVSPSTFTDLTRLVLPDRGARAVLAEIDADGRRWAPWPEELSAPRGR